MFKSSEVAYLKPSSFSSKSCIVGRGYGLHLMSLFRSLKAVNIRIVESFFGITNGSAPHSNLFTHRSTPIFTNRSISRRKDRSYALGTE